MYNYSTYNIALKKFGDKIKEKSLSEQVFLTKKSYTNKSCVYNDVPYK